MIDFTRAYVATGAPRLERDGVEQLLPRPAPACGGPDVRAVVELAGLCSPRPCGIRGHQVARAGTGHGHRWGAVVVLAIVVYGVRLFFNSDSIQALALLAILAAWHADAPRSVASRPEGAGAAYVGGHAVPAAGQEERYPSRVLEFEVIDSA